MKTAVMSGMLMLTAMFSGCGELNSTDTLVADAKSYYQKGEYNAAVIQLKNALEKNSEDQEARLLLGQVYNTLGDPVSAEKEASKALELGADVNQALPILATAYLRQGQYQKTVESLQPLEANDAAVWTLRGHAYLEMGDTSKAESAFDAALKANPQDVQASIGLARVAVVEKKMEEANQAMTELVSRHPDHVEALLFKGDLHRYQGELPAALAAYEEVVKLQPAHLRATVEKASIHIAQKNYMLAQKDVQAAKEIAPQNLAVLYTEALLHYSQGRYDQASEPLQKVLQRAPEYMPGVLLMGAVQFMQGSHQQAEQNLKKYLAKDANHPYANKLLVSVLLKNGQHEQAIRHASENLEKVPDDVHLLGLLGEAYLAKKDFAKAEIYFQKAATVAPGSSGTHAALAMTKIFQGDDQGAVAVLEDAMNKDRSSLQTGLMLASTYVKSGNHDKALSIADRLEKAHAANPTIPALQGEIHLNKGDMNSARGRFEKALSLQADYYPAIAQLARLDIVNNEVERAKKRFEAVLEGDRRHVPAMAGLAGIALIEGKKDEATGWLERAVRENPQDVQPAILLAEHHLRLQDVNQAVMVLKNQHIQHPSSTMVLELLGRAYMTAKKPEAARDTYQKLSMLKPNDGMVQVAIASTFTSMDDKIPASQALNKALELHPHLLQAYMAKAALELKSGQYDAALHIAKIVQKHHGQSAAGFVMEGDVQAAKHQPALASAAYEKAFERQRSGMTVLRLYQALQQAGDAKAATLRLKNWLNEHPDDVAVRLTLATSYLVDNNHGQAEEHFKRVLKIDQNNVMALNNLAYILHETKDPRALEYAEKAYKLAPSIANVADTLGWILIHQGDAKRGVSILKEAFALSPQSAEIQYHLAVGLLKSGDKPNARKELEKLIKSDRPFSSKEEAMSLLKTI